VRIDEIVETTNQSDARWGKVRWPPGLRAQFQHFDRRTDGCEVYDVRVIEHNRLREVDLDRGGRAYRGPRLRMTGENEVVFGVEYINSVVVKDGCGLLRQRLRRLELGSH
jgi:hypothetical protein